MTNHPERCRICDSLFISDDTELDEGVCPDCWGEILYDQYDEEFEECEDE